MGEKAAYLPCSTWHLCLLPPPPTSLFVVNDVHVPSTSVFVILSPIPFLKLTLSATAQALSQCRLTQASKRSK
jgi:hypothetical protein